MKQVQFSMRAEHIMDIGLSIEQSAMQEGTIPPAIEDGDKLH